MGLLGKYRRAKMYWRINNLFKFNSMQIELDETQKYVIKITKTIICKPDTELFESPTDCVIYAHWDHITIKVNYEDNKIIMMNGKYFYYFNIPSSYTNEIVRKIRKISAARTSQWESQFTSNTINNLEVILGEVRGNK
jgi:hypothetical protein